MLQELPYICFLEWIYGAVVMIYLHNFLVSILLYKARQANGSNLLKIIINFTGTVTFICKFIINAAPSNVTTVECQLVYYIGNINNLIYRSTIAIFLLWRLKQIGPTKHDKWIGITLVVARTVAHITYIAVYLQPTMVVIPSVLTFYKFMNICTYNSDAALVPQLVFVCFDFLIDIYVTTRLVLILRRANKNAAQIGSNIERKTKRTLFTAVMYWNFVRMIVSFGQNVIFLTLIIVARTSASDTDNAAAQNFIQCFFFVLMSYAVTVDAEIVRVIEGKNQGKGSSGSGSKKSYSGTPSARVPPYKKYSSSTQSYNEVYDENKFTVSMKRLSFFEWANIVVGFRREDGNKQEFEKEELEEIIDGSSEATDLDPDKRNSDPKRNSDISGTSTVTSTISMSSHEHDIV